MIPNSVEYNAKTDNDVTGLDKGCNKSLKIPKGIIRIRKSKKNRQHNGQKKKDKQRSKKHTHKTKDRETRTPVKPGVNSGSPEWQAVPALLVAPV